MVGFFFNTCSTLMVTSLITMSEFDYNLNVDADPAVVETTELNLIRTYD